MKRQEKMDPAQRDAYQILLKELENVGEEATPTRQILQLALQLDEKGEFWKFEEVFGSEEPRHKQNISYYQPGLITSAFLLSLPNILFLFFLFFKLLCVYKNAKQIFYICTET